MKRRRFRLSDTALLLLAAAAGFAGAAAYVAYAALRGHFGFPLDDAWIHQTYARNLAQTGAWAYVPGQASAGSTSPLWTLLISVGYAVGVPYRWWAAILGGLSVALVGFLAGRLAKQLFPQTRAAWVAALACALEWHILWAGASGMETALFAALCLGVMSGGLALVSESRPARWLLWGALGGLAFLTRPEGIIPLALSGLALVVARRKDFVGGGWQGAAARFALAAVGFLVLTVPYVVFNWRVSGALFPNTFYAKQAEYREMIAALPWHIRALRVAGVQFVGGAALLIQGILAAWVQVWRRRNWLAVLPLAWWLVAVLLYAFRLPVTYQHGRYQMPVIPILIVYGVPGMEWLVSRASAALERVAVRALALAAAVVFLAFVAVGAQTYLNDVRIIDTEMVDVAHWLDVNTPQDATLAVHDIGAIGYFTERRLLDLAGLVSPEVVPFIRDEDNLFEYIRAQGASYLVTFPSWYPEMTARPEAHLAYQTDSPWTIRAGGDNMAVYELRFTK